MARQTKAQKVAAQLETARAAWAAYPDGVQPTEYVVIDGAAVYPRCIVCRCCSYMQDGSLSTAPGCAGQPDGVCHAAPAPVAPTEELPAPVALVGTYTDGTPLVRPEWPASDSGYRPRFLQTGGYQNRPVHTGYPLSEARDRAYRMSGIGTWDETLWALNDETGQYDYLETVSRKHGTYEELLGRPEPTPGELPAPVAGSCNDCPGCSDRPCDGRGTFAAVPGRRCKWCEELQPAPVLPAVSDWAADFGSQDDAPAPVVAAQSELQHSDTGEYPNRRMILCRECGRGHQCDAGCDVCQWCRRAHAPHGAPTRAALHNRALTYAAMGLAAPVDAVGAPEELPDGPAPVYPCNVPGHAHHSQRVASVCRRLKYPTPGPGATVAYDFETQPDGGIVFTPDHTAQPAGYVTPGCEAFAEYLGRALLPELCAIETPAPAARTMPPAGPAETEQLGEYARARIVSDHETGAHLADAQPAACFGCQDDARALVAEFPEERAALAPTAGAANIAGRMGRHSSPAALYDAARATGAYASEIAHMQPAARQEARPVVALPAAGCVVTRPDRAPLAVLNLGWLLRHSSHVVRVEFWARGRADAPGIDLGGMLGAELADGRCFYSDFASVAVFQSWIARPRFAGVPVTIVPAAL